MSAGCGVLFFGMFFLACVAGTLTVLSNLKGLELLWALLPGTFALGGLGAMWYYVRRYRSPADFAEAELAKRLKKSTAEPATNPVPTLDLGDNPGTVLPVRLKQDDSPGGALIGLGIAMLVTGGGAVGLLIGAWFGRKDMMGMLCTGSIGVALLAAFAGTLYGFIRSLLIYLGVGPTLVELAAHPLQRGQSVAVYVSQAGALRLNWIEVFLVCEEKASYTQGTNTVTDTKCVHLQSLTRTENAAVDQDHPWEWRGTLTIPARAMHSFAAKNNAVGWRIKVVGFPERWPDFTREFSFVLAPPPGGGGTAS